MYTPDQVRMLVKRVILPSIITITANILAFLPLCNGVNRHIWDSKLAESRATGLDSDKRWKWREIAEDARIQESPVLNRKRCKHEDGLKGTWTGHPNVTATPKTTVPRNAHAES
ncbi:hypothetical protein BJX61DRAFT_220260 [Aspergillus egyptiacus]|nr:hypothetical protein BJX61DRAFT_220260 [Aspergillus egyptiacus]